MEQAVALFDWSHIAGLVLLLAEACESLSTPCSDQRLICLIHTFIRAYICMHTCSNMVGIKASMNLPLDIGIAN
jgi:hypothetical protein